MSDRYLLFRLLVASLSLLLPTFSWAQGTPAWNWVQQGASTVASGGRNIAVTASGNVFVTGYFTHTLTLGTTTLTADSTDAFVAKYTASGQVLWAQKLGSSGQGIGYQIVADAADNCYVSGVFRGTVQVGATVLTSQSDGDEFIVKYSAQGAPLWGQRYRDLNPTYSRLPTGGKDFLVFPFQSLHLTLDAQGNLYTASRFRDTVTRGGTTFTSQVGSYDALVVKYNPQGQVQWARQGGGTGDDYAADVAVDATGNVYVVGGFGTTATFGSVVFPTSTGTFVNHYNTYVLKYDAQGMVVWGRATVPAAFQDFASLTAVGVDGSGNVYTLGGFGPAITLGSTTFSLPAASSGHVFLAKYDPLGTVLWAQMAGSAPPNTIRVSNGADLAVQADGTATITGIYTETMTFGQLTLGTPGGLNQAFVARYTPQGAVTWAGRAGTYMSSVAGGNAAQGFGVSLDAQGAAYVTGDFGGQADFGPFVLTTSTGMYANLFVGKIGATALAGRSATATSTLAVYPVPAAAGSVTVRFPQLTSATTELRVVNAVGQLVQQQRVAAGASEVSLSTQGLRAGLYWVQALSATSRQVGTLVIP
jgi:hypothetical protein